MIQVLKHQYEGSIYILENEGFTMCVLIFKNFMFYNHLFFMEIALKSTNQNYLLETDERIPLLFSTFSFSVSNPSNAITPWRDEYFAGSWFQDQTSFPFAEYSNSCTPLPP